MASAGRVAVSSEGMGALWRVILAQKCQRQKEKQKSLIEVPRPMASYRSFPPVSPGRNAHVNPYGTFELDLKKRLHLEAA